MERIWGSPRGILSYCQAGWGSAGALMPVDMLRLVGLISFLYVCLFFSFLQISPKYKGACRRAGDLEPSRQPGMVGLALLPAPPKLCLGCVLGPSSLVYPESGDAAEKRAWHALTTAARWMLNC